MLKTEDMDDTTKYVLDAVSVVTVVGTVIQILPSIAALFTILWTGIRIWETKTVQGLFGKDLKNED